MFSRVANVIAAIFAGSILVTQTFASAGATEPQPVEVLVRQMLVASGLSGAELNSRQDRVLAEVQALAERLGDGSPSYRRARRLHDLLHRRYLKRYDPDADGLDRILEDGRYNCQAATFFMGLVARTVGIEAEILESPGHLKLRLNLPRRSVEVETTSSTGFDVDSEHRWREAGLPVESERRLGLQPEAEPSAASRTERYWRVSLEQSVGFAWLNTAWRALEQGQPLMAVSYVAEADKYLPDLAERAGGVRRLIARAFSLEYDAGRFERAYAIALIGLRLFPDSVYAQDRAVASGVKLAEQLCAADAPRHADAMLDEISLLVPAVATALEHKTSPILAAAAVRLQDWDLAWRAADRYAASEPDGREVARLISWIEERSVEDPGPWNAVECAVP